MYWSILYLVEGTRKNQTKEVVFLTEVLTNFSKFVVRTYKRLAEIRRLATDEEIVFVENFVHGQKVRLERKLNKIRLKLLIHSCLVYVSFVHQVLRFSFDVIVILRHNPITDFILEDHNYYY